MRNLVAKTLVHLSLLERALTFSLVPVEVKRISRRGGGHSVVRTHPGVVQTRSRRSISVSSVISSNHELLPGIDAINKYNEELFARLEALRESPYFRFFSVDILASCEYMPQELFECYTEGCEILPVEEDEVSSKLFSNNHFK